jgi:hypothetical protein
MQCMFFLSPWALARRTANGRRAVLLFVVAAMLYGFGMHAARACVPTAAAVGAYGHAVQQSGHPCQGEIDPAQAACETHCNTDAQSGRVSLSFDFPAAAPLDLTASLAPLAPVGPPEPEIAPPRRDTGPPLHILLHRLLR